MIEAVNAWSTDLLAAVPSNAHFTYKSPVESPSGGGEAPGIVLKRGPSMSEIRYRRTSIRTALGVTAEEKRIKRELGITALLRPFRWWGNEKRTLKRDVGYYSPEAKLARHVLPHSASKLLILIALVLGIPFALGWWVKASQTTSAGPTMSQQSSSSGAFDQQRKR